MISRPAVIPRFSPRMRSSLLGHPRRSNRGHDPGVERRATKHRPGKCRRDGHHRTVSTAPWKSRNRTRGPTIAGPARVTASQGFERDRVARRRKRLWKCRPYGNQKAVSTGTWKSRTEREIPTFPQPILVLERRREEQDDEDHGMRPVTINPGRGSSHPQPTSGPANLIVANTTGKSR